MKTSNELMLTWSTYVSQSSHRPIIADLAVTFAVIVTLLNERRATRKSLKNIPDHILKDIGISREEANLEARKPFWKL